MVRVIVAVARKMMVSVGATGPLVAALRALRILRALGMLVAAATFFVVHDVGKR